MSPRTVNKHLEHVFEKLGVETRTAAAAAAQRLQIGQDD
jgi:DNA-binding CsgD family transcriptional regulator